MGELSGYGFALLEPCDLSEFLKERKCRAKSFWATGARIGSCLYDAVRALKLCPFIRLRCAAMRSSFVRMRKFAPPAGYEVAFKRDRLYFAPQSGSAILASFDALQYSFDKLKNGELAMSVKAALRARTKI